MKGQRERQGSGSQTKRRGKSKERTKETSSGAATRRKLRSTPGEQGILSDDQDSVASTSTSSSDPEPRPKSEAGKSRPPKKTTKPLRIKSAPTTLTEEATKSTSGSSSKSRKLKYTKADAQVPDTPSGRRSTFSIRAMRERFKDEFPDDPVPSHGILRQLYQKPDHVQQLVQRYKQEFPGEPVPSEDVLKKLFPDKPEVLKTEDLLFRQDSFMSFASHDWDGFGKPKKGSNNHKMAAVTEEKAQEKTTVKTTKSKGKKKQRKSLDAAIQKGEGKTMEEWSKSYHSGSSVPEAKNSAPLTSDVPVDFPNSPMNSGHKITPLEDLDESMESFAESSFHEPQDSQEISNTSKKKGGSRKKKSKKKIKRRKSADGTIYDESIKQKKEKGKTSSEWSKTYHSGAPVPKAKNLARLGESAPKKGVRRSSSTGDMDKTKVYLSESSSDESEESLGISSGHKKRGTTRNNKMNNSSSSHSKTKTKGVPARTPPRGRPPAPIQDDDDEDSMDEEALQKSSASWWNLSVRDVSPEHRYSKALAADSPSPGRPQPDPRAKWRNNSRTRSAPLAPANLTPGEGSSGRERRIRTPRRMRPARFPSQPLTNVHRNNSFGSKPGKNDDSMKKEGSMSAMEEFEITGRARGTRRRVSSAGIANETFEFNESDQRSNVFLDSNLSSARRPTRKERSAQAKFSASMSNFEAFSFTPDNKLERFSNSFDNLDLVKGIDFNNNSSTIPGPPKPVAPSPKLGDFFGSNHSKEPPTPMTDGASVGVRSAGTLQPSSRDRRMRQAARVRVRSRSVDRGRGRKKIDETPKFHNSHTSGKKGWVSEIPGMLKYAEPQNASDSSSDKSDD